MVIVALSYISGDISNDVDIKRPCPVRTIAPFAGFKELQYAPGTLVALALT